MAAATLAATAARADQLQCLEDDAAQAARKLLAPGSVMLDYCSRCKDRVKVVLVSAVDVVHGCDEEVRVTGTVIFESQAVFDADHGLPYRAGASYDPRNTPFVHKIDLAYVYVETAPNRFNWLGGVLGLRADIKVKSLELPGAIHAKLPARQAPPRPRPLAAQNPNWQPLVEPPGKGPGIVFKAERVRFTERPPHTKVERLERNASEVATGPRGQRVVWGLSSDHALLVDPRRQRPFVVGIGNLLGAAFSPGGTYLALRPAIAPLTVVSTEDGKVIFERPVGRECEARFIDETTLFFHDDAPEGQLWSWDLARGPVARGSARAFTGCGASNDGKTWVVWDSGGNIDRLDPESGASELMARGADTPVFLSPDGARVCYMSDKELRCTRLADHQVEVLARFATEGLGFDDTGKRFLFVGDVIEHDEATSHVFNVADFERQVSLALENTHVLSGGSAALSSEGKLLLLGSSKGVWFLDLDHGKKSLHRGRALYSVANAPGVTRGGFVTTEHSDGFVQDLLLIHE